MTCADDLTIDDLNGNVSTSVLERVTAGAGSNTNLWPQIDRDKWAYTIYSVQKYADDQCDGRESRGPRFCTFSHQDVG